MQLRAGHEQVDAGIAVAAGLEARQLARELERDLADGDDGIDDRAAHAGVLGQVLGRVRAHRGRELLDRARRDAEAGGGAVAAEALEVPAAGREARVQVVGRDRAAAALAALAVERDQHDGPRVTVDEARGDDADHALVPALARGHEHAVAALERAAALDLGGGGAQDRVLDPLALAVALLDLLGQRLGLVARGREQQVERERGVAEAAGGVDARREAEAEIGRAHARRIDARARHQRAQARPIGLGEAPHPAAHERAVLVGERHDVGDRGERDEIGELVERRRQRGRVAAVTARPERLRELEHDARAAQVGERVAGARRARARRRSARRAGRRPGGGGR